MILKPSHLWLLLTHSEKKILLSVCLHNTFRPWSWCQLVRERCLEGVLVTTLSFVFFVFFLQWLSLLEPFGWQIKASRSLCAGPATLVMLAIGPGSKDRLLPSQTMAWIVSPSADIGLWWSVCCDWDPRVGLEGLNMGKEDETEAGKKRKILLSADRFCQQHSCFISWS